METIGRFEWKLRAIIAICTEYARENKSRAKVAERRGPERLCRGVLALEDKQKLTEKLRSRRAFLIWQEWQNTEVCNPQCSYRKL